MSTKTELLQEKANDLERVKRYAGAEQINTIIGKVKEQERKEWNVIITWIMDMLRCGMLMVICFG